MAQKFISDIGELDAKTITINTSELFNQIGYSKKVTCAILKLNNASISNTCSVRSNCNCGDSKIVDRLSRCSNKTVCINVTHEIDCNLRNFSSFIQFVFDGDLSCDTIDLEVEYLPQQLMYENNAYCDVDVKNVGSGRINLSNGVLQLSSAGLVYNGWQAGKQNVIIDDASIGRAFKTNCGKGWKLNLEQYLVKRKGTDDQEVYTYIDDAGNYHEFIEKYYYLNDAKKKIYVPYKDIKINDNGKLTYTFTTTVREPPSIRGPRNPIGSSGTSNVQQVIKTVDIEIELVSTDDSKLSTDYTKFIGGKYLETRYQEQIELEETLHSYAKLFKEYVIINKTNGAYLANGALKERFVDNVLSDDAYAAFTELITDEMLLLTQAEAIQYNSLLLQQTEKSSDSAIGGIYKKVSLTNPIYFETKDKAYNSIVNLKKQLGNLRAELYNLTKKENASSNGQLNYQYTEYLVFLRKATYKFDELCGLNAARSLCDSHWLQKDQEHLKDFCCDLQDELERLNNDLAEFQRQQTFGFKSYIKTLGENEQNPSANASGEYVVQVYNSELTKSLRDRYKQQKTLERRIRTFQKEFNNKIDHVQTQIAELERIINDYLQKAQGEIVNRQIELLAVSSESNISELASNFKVYRNKKIELDQLLLQLPVRFITAADGVTKGFNKDGLFVAAFDKYENQTAILYEKGKIVAVRDSDNNETAFEYNADGLLVKITDSDEKITRFEYKDKLLTQIIAPNDEITTFTYCQLNTHTLHNGAVCSHNELKSVTDNFGRGVEFVYDEYCRVAKVVECSDIEFVSDDNILNDTVSATKTAAIIHYKSEMSTSVTNSKGVTTTYIFDQLGKPVTVFEGVYDDPEDTTNSVSFEYMDGKQSFSIEENLSSANLLVGVNLSADTLNFESTPETISEDGIRQLKYVISPKAFEDKTDFVFSAWARADSAYILNSRKTDYAWGNVEKRNKTHLDFNQQKRKFELKAVVNYNSGDPDVYSASFDWLNTDWQFLTLPIAIDTRKCGDQLPATFPFVVSAAGRSLVNVELYVDYSYNIDKIECDCLSLREGKWTYSTFDDKGRKLTDEDSQTATVTKYFYDDKDRVVKQVATDRKRRQFISTFEYNKQGSLVRSTNYAGVVEETIFDEKGRAVKKITYNQDDPTSKFYEESKRDDKGTVLADVDEGGEYDAVTYTYDQNGAVAVQTDGKGNKTAYGYKDGSLVSLSGSADGEESTNVMHRTAGLLTKLTNGETTYNYEYDAWGRTRRTRIADKIYAEAEYVSDLKTKTVFADGNTVTTQKDKYDRITEKVTAFAKGIVETVKKDYDSSLNNETTTIDITGKSRYNIIQTKDKDRVVSEVRGGEYPLEKHYGYNADGDLESTEYKVGGQTLTYTHETDHTPDRRDAKIGLPCNLQQVLAYDGLGRTKEISLGENLVKDIYYAKFGDHATSRINSVWHGVNGIRKDNTRYTYDKVGNIETVTDNGEFVARYTYDGLNRLVREDNVHFGTFTYQYDAAGNILSKKSYDFTTAETLGKATSVNEYSYRQSGWKDQLLAFKYKNADGKDVAERFAYDVMGNPTVYRDRTLEWQGRRLVKYTKGTKSATYTYDFNGVRTSKTLSDGNSTDFVVNYIYDGNNLIAEQRGTKWITYFYGVDGVAGFNYDNNTYVYRKNVQGDVTHIYKKLTDGKLELVAQYVYDAWGNHKVLNAEGVEVQSTEKVIANMNPFRYRSYYFDVETQLYYLQTRYYDATIGRFISADSIEYLDPETLGGLNMYAYCGNNPVMAIDPEGNVWWNPATWDWKKVGKVIGGALLAVVGLAITIPAFVCSTVIPGAGFITQAGFSMMMYGGMVVGSVFDSQINSDMEAINWNPFNPDADKAANPQKVSFYKGVPVVNVNHPSGRSGSFLGIWLTGTNDGDTIRHEWGHTVQQGIMGWAKYLLLIGLPSWQEWSNNPYYERPWEITADYFGGVQGRNINSQKLSRGKAYLAISTLFGLLGFLFLIGEYK